MSKSHSGGRGAYWFARSQYYAQTDTNDRRELARLPVVGEQTSQTTVHAPGAVTGLPTEHKLSVEDILTGL
jgi:hypothetical protein